MPKLDRNSLLALWLADCDPELRNLAECKLHCELKAYQAIHYLLVDSLAANVAQQTKQQSSGVLEFAEIQMQSECVA